MLTETQVAARAKVIVEGVYARLVGITGQDFLNVVDEVMDRLLEQMRLVSLEVAARNRKRDDGVLPVE